jgi:predicted nucleotidyltransferase
VISRKQDFPIEVIRGSCEKYHVDDLALFGSLLREEFGAESDIDLLVEFEPGTQVGFLMLGKMQRELSTLLGRQVDLVPKRGLKPRTRQAVLESARVLYASSTAIPGA